MAVKYTIQGLLIYAIIAAYFIAFVATLLRRRKTGTVAYLLGFLVGCATIAYRWVNVGHIPMQNLFEVFLLLGVLVFPISVFSQHFLHIGGIAGDMLIGVIVLFPAGFIFNAEPQQLPPALQSWLFGPHVFVYMLSYVIMAKAAIQAGLLADWRFIAGSVAAGIVGFIAASFGLIDSPFGLIAVSFIAASIAGFIVEVVQLVIQRLGRPFNSDQVKKSIDNLLLPEEATYRMICVGFPLLTLGLITGSVWGQQAWGDWWGWDPKELWSLASWLVYVGYFHFRYMFGKKHPRANNTWAVVGLAVIIITLLWVNLSRLFPGLHSYAM